MKRIGVLAIQGDVSEHVKALMEAAGRCGVRVSVSGVKTRKSFTDVDALVLPGGESTTLGKLIKTYGIDKSIRELASRGAPFFGTCGGLIVLAKEGDVDVEKTGQPLLGLVDMKVNRNAFGRQRESFEAELSIPVLGGKPFHGIFIRAPAIEKVWGKTKVLCEFDGKTVAAQQDNILVTAFHPELSEDRRLHQYFLKML